MALYIKVERGFTFFIKKTLSNMGLLLHNQGDLPAFSCNIVFFAETFPGAFVLTSFSQLSSDSTCPPGPAKKKRKQGAPSFVIMKTFS